MMCSLVATTTAPSDSLLWQSSGPEIYLLLAGGVLTLFLIGAFIFIFTRKDSH